MKKSYANMNIKEKIAHDYGGTQLIDDVNHAVRRFFRCWLDGSYLGEAHYRRNCDFIKENFDNHRAIRSFVVNQFIQYTAHEYDCSYGHAQSCIVLAISRDNLANSTTCSLKTLATSLQTTSKRRRRRKKNDRRNN